MAASQSQKKRYAQAKKEYKAAGLALFKANHGGKTPKQASKKR